MARGIIYLIINKENGFKFVDYTLQPMNKEWQSHIQKANKMSSEPIHRAFRQYGIHRFGIQELDECDEREFEDKKKHWIEHYNSYNEGYNYRVFEEEEDDEEDEIIIPLIINQSRSLHVFTDEDRSKSKRTGCKVQGKHLETGEIKIWDSASLAAMEVTGNARKNSNILSCARNCYRCYGYKWSIVEENTKKRSIFGIHKKTERLGPRYESVAEGLRQLSGAGKGMGLIKSLKHPGHYSFRGYYWYYG
jgi:hypothetical protein